MHSLPDLDFGSVAARSATDTDSEKESAAFHLLTPQVSHHHHDDQLDDIEDLSHAIDDIEQNHARASYRAVKVGVKKAPKRFGASSSSSTSPLSAASASEDFFTPGKAAIFSKVAGCSHNVSDSEYMNGLLASHGYTITPDPASADLWLLNSCTVKNPSEQTFVNDIVRAHELGKKVVLAGCVPQGQPRGGKGPGRDWSNLSVVGVQQIDQIVYVVEETLKGHSVRLLDNKRVEGTKKKAGGASLALPKIRKNPLVEIIPINTGCLNQCTYCKTKHARGELGSYPPDEIVARVRQVIDEGVVEIWLTSEDTGTYGRDIGSSLPELLWRIVDELPTHVMLRVGMTNPPYILEHLAEMARIFGHPQVYSFLHVPIQAASDRVLEDMRRQYTQADFRHVVDFLRANVPGGGVNIATDIICGFPTESDDDFLDTLDLVRHYKFPSLHISQFYPRPGTPAARLPLLPSNVVKQRSRAMTQVFESYQPYAEFVGTRHKVLVTDVASDKRHFVAHNKLYYQVLVPMVEEYMGKMLEVEIVSATKFSMVGQVIRVVDTSAAQVGVAPVRRLESVAVAAEPGMTVDGGALEKPVDGTEIPPHDSPRSSVATSSTAESPATVSSSRDLSTPTQRPTNTAPNSNDGAGDDGDGDFNNNRDRLPSTFNSSADNTPIVTPRERQIARFGLVAGIAAFGVALMDDRLAVSLPAFAIGLGSLFVSIRTMSVPVAKFKSELEDGAEERRRKWQTEVMERRAKSD
ncbi:hypothetical protein BCR44DRAFT_37915 [Catenaria anguillulae PL171]|uniref:Threonylcarbamoyladenosine tRNA methylthiotransferase n=1 Tax=Catenaria anguillulae PL171 TaxID=765915 RepID=A0A1Y2HDC8_9FUNG|nr:hypothetical protein BCR44DRAFT_37915 [Catenaria anguillulae PL171]